MISSIIQRIHISPLLFRKFKLLFFQMESKVWFYIALYVLLFSLNCIWNWEEFQKENLQRISEMGTSYSVYPFWSLYPFQIFTIFFVAFSFLVFSALFLGIVTRFFSWEWKRKLVPLLTCSFRSFFKFFCILFLGNKILGFFHSSQQYGFFLFVFWIGLLLLFVQNQGRMYSEYILGTDMKWKSMFTPLGYLGPISFLFLFWITFG